MYQLIQKQLMPLKEDAERRDCSMRKNKFYYDATNNGGAVLNYQITHPIDYVYVDVVLHNNEGD